MLEGRAEIGAILHHIGSQERLTIHSPLLKPKEQMFSHIDAQNKLTIYAVAPLRRWLEFLKYPITQMPMNEEYINSTRLYAGVEKDYLERITDEKLAEPLIGINFPTEFRVIDGNHRLVRAWDKGVRSIGVYVIAPELIHSFEIDTSTLERGEQALKERVRADVARDAAQFKGSSK